MDKKNAISIYQKEKCLSILDKLTSYHISFMFLTPVNPERDQCPDYFQKIKHPMDLQTVRQKLESNEYATVSQFKDDVKLIWDNAILYNGKKSLITLLAKQMQIIFKEISEFLTNNEISDWANELEKIKNDVNSIAKNCPSSSSVQFSAAVISSQPSTKISTRHTDLSYNPEITTQPELSHSDKKASAKKSHGSHSQQVQQEKPISKLSKKSPKYTNHSILNVDNQLNSSIRSSHSLCNLPISKGEAEAETPAENVKNAPPLDEEQIQKLVDDIQSIPDVKIMHKIIKMIKSKNPSIAIIENDFDEIEIKVSDIKNSTLVEIQKYVESLYDDEDDDSATKQNDYEK